VILIYSHKSFVLFLTDVCDNILLFLLMNRVVIVIQTRKNLVQLLFHQRTRQVSANH